MSYYVNKFIFFLPILIFVTEMEAQDISFPLHNLGRAVTRASCDKTHYCTTVEGCSYFIDSPDQAVIAQSCSSPNGAVRRVCCPRRRPRKNPPFRPPKPEITTEPDAIFIQNSNNDCGHSRIAALRTPYVYGGVKAKEGAWPWMVGLTQRSSNGVYYPMCGGFLIDRLHVLSAAHCFNRSIPGWITNRIYSTLIGSINLNESEIYPIASIVVHELYKPGTYYNDIALLTLRREVNLPNFNPICLPDDQIKNLKLAGYGTTVAGWGIERPGSRTMSNTLKQLSEIPVVPLQDCSRKLSRKIRDFTEVFPNGLRGGFICAGFLKGGKDSCTGDSGGPLMFQDRNRWFAVGLVSFGASCGLPDTPSGYTRITTYLNWIKDNIKN